MANNTKLIQTYRHILKLNPSQILSLQALSMNCEEIEKMVFDLVETNPCVQLHSQYRSLSETYDIYNSIAAPTSWREDILYQIHTSSLNQTIAEFILDSLDDQGYCTISPQEIAKHCHTTLAEVNKTLVAFQQFEPSGIGARSLQECLQLQCKSLKKHKNLAYKLCEHLEECALGHFTKLSKELNVPLIQIEEAFQQIQTLNPKPVSSSRLAQAPSYPDFTIEIEDNHFILHSYDITQYLTLDNQYSPIQDEETKLYIQEKMNEVKRTLVSLQRRKESLHLIMSSVLAIQKNYFVDHDDLIPMKLEDIAELTHFNISTISRAISGKSYEFNHQLYFIKSLFNHSIHGVPHAKVTNAIKKLIQEEDYLHPYSDETLRRLLEEDGILVSRRCITKIRQKERILSSTKRKIIKKED